ncbi:MAG: GAF domain-containing protein [Anaerolineae bacterium]|nr:GAF domain-containing protein [Anaerolineae bacterium]
MLEIDNTSKSWMLLPVVIGERAIGLIAHIHNEEEYGSEDLITGENLASHIAGPLEKTMMYHESSQYLRRFAILNDLAVLAGKNFNLEDVIVRVCSMLAQAFDTDYIAIPILDRESKTLRGYSWTEKEEKIIKYSLSSTLEGSVVKTGEPVRINDKAKKTGFTEMKSGVSSKLVVPLRIGKEVNGVIVLESKHINAFSTWDEHLVKILASQVGNIAENIQLNEETLGRTRNLMQVNEIIRGVLGLTKLSDIAERAAELMVDRFGYELLMVMMLDNGMNELVAEGIAGEEAAGFPKGLRYAKHLGVPGEVLQTGESRLINNASASDIYLPIPGWDPGSEICVPLHDGESVFGVINVESQLPEALNQDDILILEALAGALSGVLVSARHYAELQMNLAQLAAVRETALDLGTDLELDTLLKRVVNRVRLLVDAQGAELGLVEQGEKVVKVLISENPWQDYSGYSFPFLSGVTGRVAAMGEPMVVKDFNQWRGNRETEHRAPFTTVAGVPLKLGEEVIGTLVVQDARPNRSFGSKEINVLELISPQIAIFIRNARLIKELESRIEAQRLAESRLVQSAKLAAVGEMAAGVAHELNNPLTTVTGFTELIIDSLSPDSAEYEDLKLVLQEAKRARSVVRQLLDFSRQSEILRSDVDINELMSTVLGLVHHQAQTSGVEIRVRFWDDLPLVRIDRNQIQQVFLNLAYNGIQAMPDGGIMLIQTEVAQKEGKDWVAIKIEDTGKGIEEQDLNLIFEPFYTTKPPGKGTGLGLSVSYGIIADHGGFIDVESKPGQGAMFTIWLPVEIDISIEGEGLHV